MTRLNKCYLCIGRRGSGKTTIAQKIAENSGLKICVIDTDKHPSYDDFKLTDVEDIPKWKSGNIYVVTGDPERAMYLLNMYCSNAFVMLEDSAKYVSANISKRAKAFIIDHRKRNFELLLMFHFLGDVPPYVAKQYDHMILFKTGDSLRKSQYGKFKNWDTIVDKAERINKHKSFNYCEKINIDE